MEKERRSSTATTRASGRTGAQRRQDVNRGRLPRKRCLGPTFPEESWTAIFGALRRSDTCRLQSISTCRRAKRLRRDGLRFSPARDDGAVGRRKRMRRSSPRAARMRLGRPCGAPPWPDPAAIVYMPSRQRSAASARPKAIQARPPEAYTGSSANAKMSEFRAYRIRAATTASGLRCRFLSAAAPPMGANRRPPTMAWTRRLPISLYLNDGRTLTTLAQARDLLLDLPQLDQASPHWQSAGELLLQAAYRGRQAPIFDVSKQFSRALHIDGLL